MSKVKIQGNASGTGTLTISAPNTNTDRSITLPDGAGEILTSASTLSSSNLSGALPAIDGSALTGVGGGKLLQVVQNSTGAGANIASGSFQSTNLSASITPTSTSSKILIFVNLQYKHEQGRGHGIQVDRNGTSVYEDAIDYTNYNGASGDEYGRSSVMVEDSPSSTSSLTYTIKAKTSSANNVSFQINGAKSHIVLMEIAG